MRNDCVPFTPTRLRRAAHFERHLLKLGAVIRTTSDQGNPIVLSDPRSKHAEAYRAIAKKVWDKLGEANQPRG